FSRPAAGRRSSRACWPPIARTSRGPRRAGDPARALASRPARPHRPREARPVPRARARSAPALAALSTMAAAGHAPAPALAGLCRGRRRLARVSHDPLGRRRGMTMAKTYQQIMKEAQQLVPEVSPDETRTRLEGARKPVVLDVREREEVRQGYVPGA